MAARAGAAVSHKTYVSDCSLPRLMPPALAALQIGAMTNREVARALNAVHRRGLAESSVKRFRASLSAFFAWAVLERLIVANPVTATRAPTSNGTRAVIRPFGHSGKTNSSRSICLCRLETNGWPTSC